VVTLDNLDEHALVRILSEPKNAIIKQYRKILGMEGVGLTFDPAAVRAIARKALDRGTGARGLRAVIEEVMCEVMFDIPSRPDVREVVVTPESITDGIPPLLILAAEPKQKKEA
jgi:ATP-dependent Clp protease ATP-binding subunit ClpX